MINTKKIEQIARLFHESVPEGLIKLSDNIEKKIYKLIQVQLMRFDLINREEFDSQTKILLHICEKISALECRLNALENCSREEKAIEKDKDCTSG